MIYKLVNRSPITFIVFAALCISSCTAGTPHTQDIGESVQGEISVVFYNVENFFDTINDPMTADDDFVPGTVKDWNSERYQLKLDRIAEVLSRISTGLPEFIGLSEVENEQVLIDLINHPLMKSGNYGIIHQNSPDQRGIDVALLFQTAHFKPESIGFLEVRLPEAERPTRDILYAHGQLTGGMELHFFVNHWPSRGGGKAETAAKRMAAASVLREQIANIKVDQSDAYIIAMGDFNDYPGDASLDLIVTSGMVNLMEGLKETERGSYNYRGNWDFLDQILISENLADGVGFDLITESPTAFHFPEMLYTDPKYGDEKPNKTYGGDNYYGGYSDHLPVIARFRY